MALIARGEHGRAIRERGLTPGLVGGRSRSRWAQSPGEIEWMGDDVVLLTVESQDTAGALTDLRAAASAGVPGRVRAERGRERADGAPAAAPGYTARW